jgi:hypothetical protein
MQTRYLFGAPVSPTRRKRRKCQSLKSLYIPDCDTQGGVAESSVLPASCFMHERFWNPQRDCRLPWRILTHVCGYYFNVSSQHLWAAPISLPQPMMQRRLLRSDRSSTTESSGRDAPLFAVVLMAGRNITQRATAKLTWCFRHGLHLLLDYGLGFFW